MLRKKLKQAEERIKSPETDTTEKTPLLPYGLLKGWLESHSLVRTYSADTRQVYDALIQYLEFTIKSCQVQEEPKFVQKVCWECGIGTPLLDTRLGEESCSNCGIVLSWGMNVEPEFIKPAEVDYRRIGNKIKGVTKKFIEMHNKINSPKFVSFMDKLEDMNIWANIPMDDLNIMNENVKKIDWKQSISHDCRLIGSLLAPRVSKMDEEQFRKNLISHVSEVVVDPTPIPTFKCKNCGFACFTQKHARYHCKISL
jgi:hypothetical protein